MVQVRVAKVLRPRRCVSRFAQIWPSPRKGCRINATVIYPAVLTFQSLRGNLECCGLIGHANVYQPCDEKWEELLTFFPAIPGARQVIDVAIDLVQTSCGKAVPYYSYDGNREELNQWAERKGVNGIRRYWEQKNRVSLNNKEKGILDER
ncbi:MAG: hypothetical protein ACFCD0_25340 [Gemmataceae bacterium]